MTITPGPYLWRMRPEDEYRVVEVFHDKNNGAMFCMCGSNYTHRPTQGHEFVRLVRQTEVDDLRWQIVKLQEINTELRRKCEEPTP